MKQSNYNISFKESNGVILYNIATDGILQLNAQTASLLDKYSTNIDNLACFDNGVCFGNGFCHGNKVCFNMPTTVDPED